MKLAITAIAEPVTLFVPVIGTSPIQASPSSRYTRHRTVFVPGIVLPSTASRMVDFRFSHFRFLHVRFLHLGFPNIPVVLRRWLIELGIVTGIGDAVRVRCFADERAWRRFAVVWWRREFEQVVSCFRVLSVVTIWRVASVKYSPKCYMIWSKVSNEGVAVWQIARDGKTPILDFDNNTQFLITVYRFIIQWIHLGSFQM